METAKLNGIELEYEVTGAGDPVLLISMGPIADSFQPFTSQPALQRYRLIRYRQRRSTAGPQGSQPVSFAQHAADAAALLAYLDAGRAHVAGHSTGAAIALQLALDHSACVATLALLEPPLVAAPGAQAFFEKAAPALASYGSGDREGGMAAFMSAAFSLDWETCRAQIDKHVPGSAARALNDAANFIGGYLPALSAWQFGPGEAAVITQPVLSVLGTESEPWFAQGHEMLQGWFPQLESCEIQKAAHLLHLQRPEPVARCVADFFGRHPMDATPAKERRPQAHGAATHEAQEAAAR